MALKWNNIRAVGGEQHRGFEELCAQLARCEAPTATSFVRKGTPDGGVECFATLPDGSEWGWQAKYVFALDDSQLGQLDGSVRHALRTHPRLTRYFVCMPMDRPDARIDGRVSALDRWNGAVERWKDIRPGVEFIFWGSSELTTLIQTQNAGWLSFWFDTKSFDQAWFHQKLSAAIAQAGPRYTPDLHFRLPITRELDAVARTPAFFDELKPVVAPLREALDALKRLPRTEVLSAAMPILSVHASALATGLRGLGASPVGSLNLDALAEHASAAMRALGPVEVFLKTAPDKDGRDWNDLGSAVWKTTRALTKITERLEEAEKQTTSPVLQIIGEAGSGKTHLLCDYAKQHLERKAPVVLLLGQSFTSKDAPWAQTREQLGLAGCSIEDFVGSLEAAAQVADQRVLLMVDALNEGNGREIWPHHLKSFLTQLRSPWISLVISVRSGSERHLLGDGLDAHVVRHRGFEGHVIDAAKHFFAHYKLNFASAPLASPEYQNPLFLKLLCMGLKDSGKTSVPRGFHGVTRVFDAYLNGVNERLARQLRYDPREPLVDRALNAFVTNAVAQGHLYLLLRPDAKRLIDCELPGRMNFDESLYPQLVSEGVFLEVGGESESVVIGYERLANFLFARAFVAQHFNAETREFTGSGKERLASAARFESGFIEAVWIRVAEISGRELCDVVPELVDAHRIGDRFAESVLWRAPEACASERTKELLVELSEDESTPLDILISLASQPDHPFNAKFLHRNLCRAEMADRDVWWSISLHRLWRDEGSPKRLVEWAVTRSDEADSETLHLAGLALGWMLSSTNPTLRDRATKALVSLATAQAGLCLHLVESFADVNDTYVVERIYAVAYGFAMRSHDAGAVGELAAQVYQKVFASGSPARHILLRDYARGVIERALVLGADFTGDIHLCRPPYRSEWPRIPEPSDLEQYKADWKTGSHESGDIQWSFNVIRHTVMEGEIGGSRVSWGPWLPFRIGEPVPAQRSHPRQRFDTRIAKRYVLQRVFELGWTLERFGEFDRRETGHGTEHQIHRFSQKYERIARMEILGALSDHFQLGDEDGEGVAVPYGGPWQLSVRDIDPSNVALPDATTEASWWCPDEFTDWGREPEWVASTTGLPRLERFVIVNDPAGTEWVSLRAHFSWSEPTEHNADGGECWHILNGYMIRLEDVDAFADWAEGQSFEGRWMPEGDEQYGYFLGEHAWSEASARSATAYCGDPQWSQPRDCPVQVRTLAVRYRPEFDGDQSLEERAAWALPAASFVRELGLHWSGSGGNFVDSTGLLVVRHERSDKHPFGTLLIRRDVLSAHLDAQGMTMAWAFQGEKRVVTVRFEPWLLTTATYVLKNGVLTGFTRRTLDNRATGESRIVEVTRVPAATKKPATKKVAKKAPAKKAPAKKVAKKAPAKKVAKKAPAKKVAKKAPAKKAPAKKAPAKKVAKKAPAKKVAR